MYSPVMCGTVETVEREGVTSAVLSISWSNLCPTAESGWSSMGTHSVRQKHSSNSSSCLNELVTSVSIMPKLVWGSKKDLFNVYLIILAVHLIKYCVSFFKKIHSALRIYLQSIITQHYPVFRPKTHSYVRSVNFVHLYCIKFNKS